MKSWTGQTWTKDQLVFMVEAVLVGVIDRLWLPDDDIEGEREESDLLAYEKGALEAAGMTLGVMYAKITNDGLGIYDALSAAGGFDAACERLVARSWSDNGRRIHDRQRELREQKRSYNVLTDLWEAVYPGLYPDSHKHAVAFVDKCFGNQWPWPINQGTNKGAKR